MNTDLFEGLDGRDVIGAQANRGRSVIVTKPSRFQGLRWLRRVPLWPHREAGRPGAGMIAVATGLLFVLGAGLLAVSLAAQYAYLLRQRHQHAASLAEALALDLGLLIFSLLALGLARAGKPARAERMLILACAAGSAVMNFAAADVASPRSVLAFTMPPLFLAVVADRVISVVRRHYLGDAERSAWSAVGRGGLYALRVIVAPPSTLAGARQALLNATPLPAAIEPPRLAPAPVGPPKFLAPPSLAEQVPGPGGHRQPREGSKTSRFLELVKVRFGELAGIEPDEVYRISNELAPEVELDTGSARTALRQAVLSAREAAAAALGGAA